MSRSGKPLLNSTPSQASGRSRPVIVTGPTGVGKSAFACALAERVGGEIVGADAFQLYRGLPLLTAQPGQDLRLRVPHHLTGVLDLDGSYDAAAFVRDATACVRDIQSRGSVPILVGGTGLYLKAFTHGLADLPPLDAALRKEVSALTAEEALSRLAVEDAEALAQIDTRNPVRVRRALEIVLQTGKPLADSRTRQPGENAGTRGLVLARDRAELRQRITKNVDAMFEGGVCGEVEAARHAGPAARRAIGFGEIEAFLDGRIGEQGCREAIVNATWRYAKRQMTWCRTQFDFPCIELAGAGVDGITVENALALLEIGR